MHKLNKYLPILKWKAGEQVALRNLTPEVKSNILPLLEVVDVPVRTGGGSPKTATEHLTNAAIQMEKCWGSTAPLLLDTHLLAPGVRIGGGSALAFTLEQAHARSIRAVPVVSTTNGAAELRALVGPVAAVGVALRESIKNVLKPTFPATLARTLHALRISPSQVDFVLDVGEVSDDSRDVYAVVVEKALASLPSTEWRSLTVASAAFPVNLAGMRPGLHSLPRADWQLWTAVDGSEQHPGFGDYAIAHPDLQDLDMRKVKVSASIRYTTADSFVVARGRAVTDDRFGGYGQFNTLADDLVNSGAFAGASFSWGDDYIVSCAQGGKSGNLTTWRQVGTNHHITMVVRQLASRSGT
jgi:hypothetical protein